MIHDRIIEQYEKQYYQETAEHKIRGIAICGAGHRSIDRLHALPDDKLPGLFGNEPGGR